MNTSSLVTFLKNSGVGNVEIRKIVAAAEVVESERLESVRAVADHTGLVELPSPMAAAASDVRKAAIIRQTAGMIKNATRYRYSLPMDKPIDEYELNVALRAASIDTRLAIKENLHSCGLIRD